MGKLIQRIVQFSPRNWIVGWLKNRDQRSDEFQKEVVFVRRQSSSIDKWFEDNADYEALARKFLGSNVGNCSVYQLDSVLNEAKILLALFTIPPKVSFDTTAGIRIPKIEIEKIGLRLVQTQGTTDVQEVDKLHWEIEGTEYQFKKLAEFISQGGKKCEDRFRVLEKNRVRAGMKNFVNLPGLPESIRKKCLIALK